MDIPVITAFSQLALGDPVFRALDEVGYESPSPIQARTIPLILEGRDVIGQAQTGTGKTAAFALPLLTRLDMSRKDPQVLVLTPTRELAIQVAEAFQTYASKMKKFHVLPVYGGQDFGIQLRTLKRGTHVVVGTPGRVMDHMRRGTLKLDGLATLVLDEADEMLRMGFIDDVEWILQQTPESRQVALFSATMPAQIRRIANQHLRNPAEITIQVKTTTAETIRQRYWPVRGLHKLDALTRILEAESFDAMLVFVRTKTATVELADKLTARGYASSALNGDMTQQLRERTVDKLKKGRLDILVATDVAARGLDVERISHVLNYDISYDTETYVHRIGRTGRAGRSGEAILFVAHREMRMLKAIEKATGQKIAIMELPSTELINDKRIDRFMARITEVLDKEDLNRYRQLISQYQQQHNVPAEDVAAALAKLVQGDNPMLLEKQPSVPHKGELKERQRRTRNSPEARKSAKRAASAVVAPEAGMERFRIEVGHQHDVKPANIVGAIANEADLDSQFIGRISIFDDHSLVDLPEGMPKEIFRHLKKVWVAGQKMDISHYNAEGRPGRKTVGKKPARKKSAGKVQDSN